ncbi:MAG: TadE family protein [Lachnospiraceae bacterium]|nr:TadE family protein [Lachnospiraceae bacterium]
MEAALVLPLFLFAAVTVLSFCRILQVEWGVQTAMHEVVRGAALAGSAFEPSEVVLAGTARAKIISDGVPVKYIWGDIVGISFASSSVTEDDITMVARYRINPLVPLPGYKGFRIENRVYARRFTGFHPGTAGTEETYVYITPYGKAYHKDLRCSYLEPDIRCVMKDAVGGERNSGGGRYTSCPRCRKYGFGRILYVTTYGKVYHSRIDCPALKRTVKRVKLKEAEKTHHICPKCGTEEAEVTGDEDITDLVEEAEALARAAEGG